MENGEKEGGRVYGTTGVVFPGRAWRGDRDGPLCVSFTGRS